MMTPPTASTTDRPARHRRPATHSVRSFVLVEVLVSMVILGIALASVLRGYTNGLSALSRDRKMATAVFLAQGLLDDFEIEPPEDETVQGNFGSDFPGFSFVADCEDVEVKYRNVDIGLARREFDSLRHVVVRIYYQPPDGGDTVRVLRVETLLTGIEKYARETKFYNALY